MELETYPLLKYKDIIILLRDKPYISTTDATAYFY